MLSLDEIDYKIIDILQSHGRTRRNDLAESVGLSIPAVSERMRKLEDAKYITGYFARVDPRKLGKDITAFIEVTVDSSKHFASFVDHANNTDDILECHAITGKGSHLLKIRTENTSTLEKLLAKIQSWTGVSGTQTHLVLSTKKETSKITVTTSPSFKD
jgi:Lrp/AsnC family leucine-responsive transcriptional regulator